MKIIKFILIFIIVVGIFTALITGANICWFWSVFNWLQNLIHVTTGFDALIAKALASIILAAVVMLPIGKVILSFSPIPQKNKRMYRSIVFVVMFLFFLLSFLGSRDTYFNVKTGKALKYYSVLPNGEYRVYSEPGFDPLTGQKLKEVTGEIALKIKASAPKSFFIPDSVWKEKEPVESSSDKDMVKTVKKIVPVDNDRGIRKLKNEHRQTNTQSKTRPVFHQTYLQPADFKNVNSGVGGIHFENCMGTAITVYDSRHRFLYEIKPHYSKDGELSEGRYFYRIDNVEQSFVIYSEDILWFNRSNGFTSIVNKCKKTPEQWDYDNRFKNY